MLIIKKDVEETVEVFNKIKEIVPTIDNKNLERVKYYSTWFREPDFRPDYSTMG